MKLGFFFKEKRNLIKNQQHKQHKQQQQKKSTRH